MLETLARPKPETTTNPEQPYSFYDGGGALRDKFLEAAEWRQGEIGLPRGTVSVEASTGSLDEASIFEMSQKAGLIMEQRTSFVGEKGYDKLLPGESLSILDANAKRYMQRERRAGKTSPNLTFLYDTENKPGEAYAVLPAVAIVHETLSVEQLANLREKLAGVPFINGKNELLDEVGLLEQKAKRREQNRSQVFGGVAMAASALKTLLANENVRAMGITHRDFSKAEALSDKASNYTSPPAGGPSLDKTHMPKSTSEQSKPGWNISPEASAAEIAQQAIDIIVPKSGAMTPEKLDEFSNKVKKELSKQRIHPDVDERAKAAYAAVDDTLNERRKRARVAA